MPTGLQRALASLAFELLEHELDMLAGAQRIGGEVGARTIVVATSSSPQFILLKPLSSGSYRGPKNLVFPSRMKSFFQPFEAYRSYLGAKSLTTYA